MDGLQLAELARRIALALKTFQGFIYQRDIDDPKAVLTVVRSSGIAMLLSTVTLSQQHGLYALLLNDKGCRTECIYEKGCSPSDNSCIEKCVQDCRSRMINKIAEALSKYAERKLRTNKH